MTAAEFLQREQERAYGEITRPPVNLGMLIRQNPEALRRRLLGKQRPRSPLEGALKYDEACGMLVHAAAVNLPTPYEDPFTYSMMLAYAKDLEDALAKAFNVRFKTRPLMGTLPLGRANAAAIRVPFMGEFIVVFHHGLFAFVNLLAKVVAAAIPSDGSTEPATFRYEIEEIDERMQHNPVILERFIDALTSYLLDGRPRTRGQYVLGTAKPYLVRDIGAISRIVRSRPRIQSHHQRPLRPGGLRQICWVTPRRNPAFVRPRV